jgi:chromosomal replication initiation ATPase DnaA
MDINTIAEQLKDNLNSLLVIYKTNPQNLSACIQGLAVESDLQEIIPMRAMLRDIEYTLKTAYDNDDRRIHQYSYIICKIFDTDMDKLANRDKTNDLPLARQILTFYLTRIHIPRLKIIELFNYSDLSSVIYNIKKINELIEIGDSKTISIINSINTEINLTSTTNS